MKRLCMDGRTGGRDCEVQWLVIYQIHLFIHVQCVVSKLANIGTCRYSSSRFISHGMYVASNCRMH